MNSVSFNWTMIQFGIQHHHTTPHVFYMGRKRKLNNHNIIFTVEAFCKVLLSLSLTLFMISTYISVGVIICSFSNLIINFISQSCYYFPSFVNNHFSFNDNFKDRLKIISGIKNIMFYKQRIKIPQVFKKKNCFLLIQVPTTHSSDILFLCQKSNSGCTTHKSSNPCHNTAIKYLELKPLSELAFAVSDTSGFVKEREKRNIFSIIIIIIIYSSESKYYYSNLRTGIWKSQKPLLDKHAPRDFKSCLIPNQMSTNIPSGSYIFTSQLLLKPHQKMPPACNSKRNLNKPPAQSSQLSTSETNPSSTQQKSLPKTQRHPGCAKGC
ncbi:hypothetical protein VP01_91g3 [Puccinia sorghi]|uniref:Uncharacterized protein n=1 Tax=Puccinia sorghi TaxID=27349 RepID=A0A0L6U7C8_9BASI|nr:hypothetical protein VP01_91g3 [Puccinia sorghi]